MHAELPRAQDSGAGEHEAGVERVDVLLGHLRPLDDARGLEARVLRRIHAARVGSSVAGRRTTGVWIGVGIAALAASAVGAWLAGNQRAPSSRARAAPALAAHRDESATMGRPVNAPPEARTAAEPAPTSASPSALPAIAPGKAAHAPTQLEPARANPPPESLLYAAATALRRDRNPSRALELLRELRIEAPSLGAREDARALEVEAHHRLSSPRTRALAEAYLRDFPSGRFRATALNVLGGAHGGE